ncbi:MAG: chorismate mutase/prephenate dehydratase [Gammaproteobacteria bacterium]|jgi:chorismate mutase/prephenate dehydratase
MASDNKLDIIRNRIDDIDKKLIGLINDRATLATEVAEIKKANHGSADFYRPEREAQILRRVIKENKGPLADEELARLFRELMSACLALEQKLKISFLGPEGTFSHSAVLKHFGDSVECCPATGIDQVFQQVQSGACDYGVVPIENSIEGVINQTLDLLIISNLKICGEVELRINQCLMSSSKNRKKIKKIYSHQQSLAQCRAWLDSNMPGIERIPVISNAEAARLAKSDEKIAAIGGIANAELYKLKILDQNVEDESDNSTRFLVISDKDIPPSGDDKTSLLFSMPSKPGALLKMLQCFADNNINMTRIESRPSRRELWEYIFYVDIEGHAKDKLMSKAIKRLNSEASMVKLLGSYPRAVL